MDITVATTSAEIDAITACWDEMSIASPHAGRALSTLVLQTSGHAARPHVILIRDGDRQPILVVGRVERRPMQIKVGYRTLHSIPARWLVVVAGGVVGARTQSDHDAAMSSLCASLRRGEADILVLSKVEVDGPLHAAALQHLAWYQRGHAATPLKRHRSDLSHGFEAFLSARSRGTRWRLRRRLRKLDEVVGDREKMTVRRIRPGDEVDGAVRLLEGIATKSYQRGIGVGFVDDELHRGLMSWAVADGPYRVWVLYIDGAPVAFLNGVLHDRTFFLFETAFDPSAAVEEPGAILLARVLEELAAEPDVDGFDYGFGDAQYKQSLSDAFCDEVDVVGFAARPRALFLNVLSTAVAVAVSTTKRLLGSERVAKLRRRERAELAPVTSSDGEVS
jgi:hypothetical protein